MPSIKERLREGPPLSGYLNLIPSPVATQALAAAGADVVVIDQEHGPIGPESVHAMVAATAGTECSPRVRPLPAVTATTPSMTSQSTMNQASASPRRTNTSSG